MNAPNNVKSGNVTYAAGAFDSLELMSTSGTLAITGMRPPGNHQFQHVTPQANARCRKGDPKISVLGKTHRRRPYRTPDRSREPGGAIGSQAEPGGARRSQEELGGSRRSKSLGIEACVCHPPRKRSRDATGPAGIELRGVSLPNKVRHHWARWCRTSWGAKKQRIATPPGPLASQLRS